MDDKLGHLIDLTRLLLDFRNAYGVALFATIGFVIQRNGYRSNLERWVITCTFLLFSVGNLAQTWVASVNMQRLGAESGYLFIDPWLMIVSRIPFDVAVACVLLFAFKVDGDPTRRRLD